LTSAIDTALVDLDDREFKNLTRSTIPLLSYWREDSAPKATSLLAALDLFQPGVMRFDFGLLVESVPGAAASETDLMITHPGEAVAVEAKWSEPRYETVEFWKKKSSRWTEVINHWFSMIKPFGEVPSSEDADGLVYQMIHRCASACFKAGSEGVAGLIYQIFVNGRHSTDFYESDLELFCRTLKPNSKLRIALQTIPILPNENYQQLLRSA
jgi:hypothetical protein